jgi:TPP-dependent pyruvate/acetoin dehydrogenase alpha subunit
MFDAELYRAKTEVEEWKARDPITSFSARLRAEGSLSDADLELIENEVAAEVTDAVNFAEAGTWEPIEDLTRFVYSEGKPV